MTTFMLSLLSLSGAALSLSICALYVALRSSARSQSRRLSELLKRLEELQTDHDSINAELVKQLNRERARANMASLRASRKAPELDAKEEAVGASGKNGAMTEAEKDEWQRTMNLKLMTGEVKLPGRR